MKRIAVPILCYHRIHADDDPAMPRVVAGGYCGHVTAGQFRRQMEYLAGQGFRTVTQDGIASWLSGGEAIVDRSIAIHFDDNRYNVLENGLPIMRALGFAATMFVITDLADGKAIWDNDFRALTWADLAGLVEAGWCIGAHTKTHVTLGNSERPVRDRAHLLDEIVGSQETIRKRLGVRADHFAYPTGTYDDASEAVVKRHFRTARLWAEPGAEGKLDQVEYVRSDSDPYRLTGINISARLSFEAFCRIVDGANHPGPERPT